MSPVNSGSFRLLRLSLRPTNHARLQRSRSFSSSAVRGGILGLKRVAKPKIRVEPKRPPIKPYREIKVYPCLPSTRERCKEPLEAIRLAQLQTLDPTGARTRLFDRKNREGARVGDILLVRLRDGNPYSGICMNVRRQGIDTAILLRNTLTRVGTEMWYKIYSPNVEGIEIVQRRRKKARRARLYYLRNPRHDIGSVENIVKQYTKQRQALRSKNTKGRDANADRKNFKTK